MDSVNILAFLTSVSLRSLVLFAAAGLVLSAFRVRAAATRHAMWTVVAGGMLLLTALSPALPPLPLPLLKPDSVEVAQLPDAATLELPALIPAPPAPPPAASRFTWQEAAVAAYAVVGLLLLGRLAFGYLFTRRLLRAATPVTRFDDTYTSTWISVPMTIGRKVLLPGGWESWDEAKLQAVMAHERTHVRRADWAVALLAGGNRCIFWFHPLAWWLERHLATLAEQACDDSALLLVPTEPYAQALLDMAAAVRSTQGRLNWEAMAMAKTGEIRMRIDRILDETRQIPRALTRGRWLALLAGSLPMIWLASVAQLVPATAQQAPKTAAAMSEFLKGRRQLSSADVNLMEQYLAGNPHDVDARTQVVLYYYSIGVREPRLTHILWLITNHPESNSTAFVSSGVQPRESAMNSVADYQRVVGAWKQAVAANQNNPLVLVNAAQFFQGVGELDSAEGVLQAAASMQSTNMIWKDRLAKLYALAILESSGDPKFPASKPDFSQRVRSLIVSSEDGNLLFATGAAINAAVRKPMPGQPLPAGVLNLDEHPLLQPAVALGQQLMERAAQYGGPRMMTLPAPTSGVKGGVPGGTPGGVLGGIISSVPSAQVVKQIVDEVPLQPNPPLVKKVDPEYPPLARQARISGIVRLRATIAADGSIKNIQVASGHPLLVPPTLNAVKQWVFQGTGSDVTTLLEIPFVMSPGDISSAQAAPEVRPATPSLIRVGANVQVAKLLQKVDPIYPSAARSEGIEGNVTLKISIAEDGQVDAAEPVEGNPVLAAAAQEAVRQWRYQPTLLNGQPVRVETTVIVPFQLR
jgi:TonB family protein